MATLKNKFNTYTPAAVWMFISTAVELMGKTLASFLLQPLNYLLPSHRAIPVGGNHHAYGTGSKNEIKNVSSLSLLMDRRNSLRQGLN